jgi:protein-tyrosine phosphatase
VQDRALAFDACLNVRDLGGIATPVAPIRARSVVRADSLCRLSDRGRDALVSYGVRTVIDLRGHEEIAKEPNPFAGAAAVRYLHLPLQSAVTIALMHRVETGEIADRLIVDLSRTHVVRVFRAIANATPGAVLFHCYAGKDRTGIVAALLLDLAGAPREAIVEDYMLSDPPLQRFHEKWLADAHPLDRDRVRSLIVCRPERPAALLAHLDERYGGVASYLAGGGMPPDEIDRLRARLLRSDA